MRSMMLLLCVLCLASLPVLAETPEEITALKAENQRLQAENEKLITEAQRWSEWYDYLTKLCNQHGIDYKQPQVPGRETAAAFTKYRNKWLCLAGEFYQIPGDGKFRTTSSLPDEKNNKRDEKLEHWRKLPAFQVGQWGEINLFVVKVLGPTDMLVAPIAYRGGGPSVVGGFDANIVARQIPAAGKPVQGKPTFRLVGQSTRNIADGMFLPDKVRLVIVGTTQAWLFDLETYLIATPVDNAKRGLTRAEMETLLKKGIDPASEPTP